MLQLLVKKILKGKQHSKQPKKIAKKLRVIDDKTSILDILKNNLLR